MFRFLVGLREVALVFITLGNHEDYSGVPIDRYAELADRHKITLLINQAAFIQTDAGEIAIVGVDDPSLHRADLSCLPPRAENRFTLLLAHAPNILDQLEDHHAVDLILCGHSHGGQCRIPGVPTVWLPQAAAGESMDITENRAANSMSIAGLAGRFFPCGGIAHRRSPASNGSTNRRNQKTEG